MRARGRQQSDAPVRIAEGDEIFAQETHANRSTVAVRKFFGEQRRQPIAAHHRSGRRRAVHATDEFLLFRAGKRSHVRFFRFGPRGGPRPADGNTVT